MAAILSTNMASLYAQRSMATAQAELSGSVEKLSSGKRINSAKDDAAGLGISQSIAGISNINNQSVRNLQNATSLVQTADGALDVVGKMLQRILTLTTQKNDQALNANQRSSIEAEVTALTDEISRIRERTKFNSSGTIFGQTYTFGAGSGVTMTIQIPELTTTTLGLQSALPPVGANLLNGAQASRFNIANNFSDGEILQYQNLSGADIPDLISGEYYTVFNRTADSFQLRDTNNSIVTYSALGVNDDDYFLVLPAVNTMTSTITAATASTTDTIILSQSWDDSLPIIFDKKGSNNDVGGFVDGGLYNVALPIDPDSASIRLIPQGSQDTVDFNVNSNLSGTSLNRLTNSAQLNAMSTIDVTANTFDVTSFYSSLTNGQLIYFREPLAAVNGISTGVYAVIKGGAIPSGFIQLAEVSSRTTPIDLSNLTTNPLRDITFQYANSASILNLTANSLPALNTIQITPQVGSPAINVNDIVIYSEGQSPIPGLIDDDPYTVITANNGSITLRDKNGVVVSLSDPIPNSFTGASFQVVTKITFDSTSPSVVTLADSVLTTGGANHGFSTGDALIYSFNGGTGLTGLNALQPQTTFYAIEISPSQFKLATSYANAIAGNSITDLGNDGLGSQFTRNSTVSISSVSDAIRTNASNRATLGSYLSALSYAIDNLETMSNNLGDAYSRIVDTDFAAETANLTKNKILQEASAAMLAQANQMPNVVLSLLK